MIKLEILGCNKPQEHISPWQPSITQLKERTTFTKLNTVYIDYDKIITDLAFNFDNDISNNENSDRVIRFKQH